MRRLLLLLFAAVPAFAQQELQPLLPVVDRALSEVQLRADAIKRDTFIHAALVSVANDLRDFQHNNAMQRALERTRFVKRRMMEFKAAPPPSTVAIVSEVEDLLAGGRSQGDSANLDELQNEVRKRGAVMQSILFREVETARRQRQTLSDVQTRVWKMTDALDSATNEALDSMTDYVRGAAKN